MGSEKTLYMKLTHSSISILLILTCCLSIDSKNMTISLRSVPEHPLESGYEIVIGRNSDGNVSWRRSSEGSVEVVIVSDHYMKQLAKALDDGNFFSSRQYYENTHVLDGNTLKLTVTAGSRVKTVQMLNKIPDHLKKPIALIHDPEKTLDKDLEFQDPE
jgi:hypothetical protein